MIVFHTIIYTVLGIVPSAYPMFVVFHPYSPTNISEVLTYTSNGADTVGFEELQPYRKSMLPLFGRINVTVQSTNHWLSLHFHL